MSENSIRKRITGKTDEETAFSVEFGNQTSEEVTRAFMDAERIARATDIIKLLRRLCNNTDEGAFIPKGSLSNQMKTVCLSAAASYPVTLTKNSIEKKLKIPFNSYKVYVTAKKHDSSRYLSLDKNNGVSISLDGVIWAASVFEDKLAKL